MNQNKVTQIIKKYITISEMATNVSKTFKRTFASSVIRNQLKDVVIVGAARTPMGSFRGYDVLYTLINLNIRSS